MTQHFPPESVPTNQPPVLTKAYFSVICGLLSMPSCFCFAVPSLVLGGLAIWLGVWVKKNQRGNSAGELANLWAVIGIILGSIGCILGLIGVGMMLIGGMGAILESISQSRP